MQTLYPIKCSVCTQYLELGVESDPYQTNAHLTQIDLVYVMNKFQVVEHSIIYLMENTCWFWLIKSQSINYSSKWIHSCQISIDFSHLRSARRLKTRSIVWFWFFLRFDSTKLVSTRKFLLWHTWLLSAHHMHDITAMIWMQFVYIKQIFEISPKLEHQAKYRVSFIAHCSLLTQTHSEHSDKPILSETKYSHYAK